MSRKSKLFFSLISLCFSIAVLCFGVYSALSVSYSISGSVSYEINDVFVELDLSVYRALSTTPVNSATHNQNVSTIKDAGDNISETDFGKLSYTDHESTYENGAVKPGNKDGIFEADSPNLALTYGSPTNDNQGYAFYIVIDIYNLGSEIINAQITAPTSLENTILRDSGNVEIAADSTERIVLGLALDDVTTGISADFQYTITISRGELPIEPITDMTFTVDEATKTATLRSYGGSGVDVVIPESIGYGTGSSVALTFETMEDMVSGMNMIYLYQDLYITLPNQEAQLIENPLLWRNRNAEAMEATPEDYFPMTIQTVDSYTIDQEDYNQYAELDQSILSDIVVAPFASMGVKGSVDVQYGEEEKSFTFNMENYNDNAAVNEGDDSETITPIDEFMSKMETDPESLLPVTYSNFEYNVLVKGGEYSVTSIGSYAFGSDLVICNLYIPNTIISIDFNAFGSLVSSPIIENVYAEDLDTLLNIDYSFIPSSNASSGSSIISLTNPFCIADNVYINGELLPEEITIEDGLTEIKPGTLAGLDTVKTINIPSSVTSIGADAFLGCDDLATVTFGANSQLESIGGGAFSGCSNLTSIEIPSSVKSIGSSAFKNCYALAEVYNYSIHIPQVTIGTTINSYLGQYAKVVYNPSDLTGDKPATRIQPIGNVQYYKDGEDFIALAPSVARDSLTTLTLDSRTTEINQNAFSDCDALATVTFGANSQLESIGEWAFSSCSNLTSIEIPSSVTSIGSSAFSSCYALAEVYNYSTHIPEVTIGNSSSSTNGYLGQYAKVVYKPSDLTGEKPATRIQPIGNVQYYVYGEDFIALAPSVIRDSLTTLTLDSSTTEINQYAFNNCDVLETVTFGANSQLASIGSSAFDDCSNLTSIEIPNSVTSIGSGAFRDCSNLTSIEIPSSVTSIGGSAFSRTPWLTNLQKTSYGIATASHGQTKFVIEVPTDIKDDKLDMTNVKVIADYAFQSCRNLTSIKIPSSVTSIGYGAFSNCYALETVTFEDTTTEWTAVGYDGTLTITIQDLQSSSTMATYLTETYRFYTWTKKQSA